MDFVVKDVKSKELNKTILKRENKNINHKKTKKPRNEPTEQNGTKISKADLYKPPTVEELNQLRETEILFNSNLFRLQTEELIKEISFKEKRIALINTWINQFKEYIQTIPEIEIKLSDVGVVLGPSKIKNKLKEIATNIPLQIKTDQDSTFQYSSPKTIETVGLFNIKAISKPLLEITLNIVAPKCCFNERDYMNSRYLVKRSLYLSILSTNLQKSDLSKEINYSYLNGNKLIPILQVMPAGIKDTIVNIQITPEENTFKFSRFQPGKNNLRSTYIDAFFGDVNIETDSKTPFYNSVIQNDLTLVENDKFNMSTLHGLQGASEGLILLKIWLKQRGLFEGYGNFNEEILYSFLCFLAKNGKINKHMSSYQVIRNFWAHLANSSWDKSGISLCDSPYDLETYQKSYDVVFIDKTGMHNLAANLDLNVYFKIKNEAKLAISYLDDGKFNSFQSLFITKMPYYLHYDAIIHIENDEKLKKMYDKLDIENRSNYLSFKQPLILKNIIENLKEGLSDRVDFITPILNSDLKWDIGEKDCSQNPIIIGLNLNYFNLFKVVEKGPATYEPEAKKFRDFWGEKAELRRFKDGSITEAVYWPAATLQDKRKLFKEITNFILEQKLNIKYYILSDQFEPILRMYPHSGLEEGNLKVINTFDELGKILRNLKLPLGISAVYGISESFSHCDPYPPIPANYIGGKKITFNTETNIMLKENHNFGMIPKYVCPIEGILQMAVHSKWPNDYLALCNLKTAFYIEISKQLSKEYNIKSNPKPNYLDILFNGLVYRLNIFHPKQIIELKKVVDETGIISYEENDESILQEQKFVILPKIVGALNGIHAQYPSFGPSTALIKRWLNSQLIDDFHFPHIIVSLLNASLYVTSAPFQQSALPQVAFFRFLHMLAYYDWSIQPVIINFNNEITRDQLDEHESNFNRNRSQYSPLHIITPFDNFKSILTKNAPTHVILNRLKVLGTECISIIEKNIHSKTLFDTKIFLTPNLTGYNVLIHLRPLLNPRRLQNVDFLNEKDVNVKVNEYEKQEDEKIPVVDFNPVDLYLKELRRNYSDFALFFHDSFGGNIITVIWKPVVFEKEDFKISHIGGKMLTNDKKIKANIDAIVEDFYILGEGLVRTIETK